MLTSLLMIIHLVVCVALILIILLQTGKGAGMGAAFGGASQTLFGATGRVTFLTKVTIVAGVIFGLSSMGLSFLTSRSIGVAEQITPKSKSTGLGTKSEPGAESNVPGGFPGPASTETNKESPSSAPPAPGDGLPDFSPGSGDAGMAPPATKPEPSTPEKTPTSPETPPPTEPEK